MQRCRDPPTSTRWRTYPRDESGRRAEYVHGERHMFLYYNRWTPRQDRAAVDGDVSRARVNGYGAQRQM